jgi:hypothetical protein
MVPLKEYNMADQIHSKTHGKGKGEACQTPKDFLGV